VHDRSGDRHATPVTRWLESGVIPMLIDCTRWPIDDGARTLRSGPVALRAPDLARLLCPTSEPLP
jgi:hypothetical protein